MRRTPCVAAWSANGVVGSLGSPWGPFSSCDGRAVGWVEMMIGRAGMIQRSCAGWRMMRLCLRRRGDANPVVMARCGGDVLVTGWAGVARIRRLTSVRSAPEGTNRPSRSVRTFLNSASLTVNQS